MTTNTRQVYRSILKSLTFIGLIVLAFFMIRSAVQPPNYQTKQTAKPITIDISDIQEGQIKIIRWDDKDIGILYRTKEMQKLLPKQTIDKRYFVFINSGGDINCPLNIDASTKIHLKDICSGYRYDGSGKVIKTNSRVHNLIIPPHHFIQGNKMIIGE